MTLVLLVLLPFHLPRLFASKVASAEKAHHAVWLAAFALFPVQVLTNLAAFGGTFGAGATSMFRSVSPQALIAIPCIQLALFGLCVYLRLSVRAGTSRAAAILPVIPAAIPASYVILWAGMWYHWF
jgi:hypothetical protein